MSVAAAGFMTREIRRCPGFSPLPAPQVLVVDDDRNILHALGRILRVERWQLALATNGRDAEARVAAGRFDLVLSDYNMPGGTGVDLFSAIRAKDPRVRLVMMSGSVRRLPWDRLESLNVSAVVPKPWDAPHLRWTLRTSLGHLFELPRELDRRRTR